MSSSKEVGCPAYLISHKWLKQYHKFILFEQFDQNVSEDQLELTKETHFTKNHPGLMLNADELTEEDRNKENLFGTGKVKGMEAQFIDQYIEQNKNN
jgi:hypothetical protein